MSMKLELGFLGARRLKSRPPVPKLVRPKRRAMPSKAGKRQSGAKKLDHLGDIGQVVQEFLRGEISRDRTRQGMAPAAHDQPQCLVYLPDRC
jgi:hypothetical protein